MPGSVVDEMNRAEDYIRMPYFYPLARNGTQTKGLVKRLNFLQAGPFAEHTVSV